MVQKSILCGGCRLWVVGCWYFGRKTIRYLHERFSCLSDGYCIFEGKQPTTENRQPTSNTPQPIVTTL